MDHKPLFSDDDLLSHWEPQYRAWHESGEDAVLRHRLRP